MMMMLMIEMMISLIKIINHNDNDDYKINEIGPNYYNK